MGVFLSAAKQPRLATTTPGRQGRAPGFSQWSETASVMLVTSRYKAMALKTLPAGQSVGNGYGLSFFLST